MAGLPRHRNWLSSLVHDKGVLAGRSRHDFCPQSFVIRGVLSPDRLCGS
jgi:hypothetical protein